MPLRLRNLVAREKRTVRAMVEIYCRDLHGHRPGGLCAPCRELLSYSHARLDRCPYGEEKPSCKACPIHCYQPDPRERMREVMRYSGPRMLWRHPWLALVHLWLERARPSPGKPLRRRSRA
ncbi:MAG TPA: nitrous oxide-stimulated promoter family protein [Vicinamibacterales bacterium]|nr:nitrous oxide-stimulated promoter family protein [Vicinamibacterales bacterium]